MIRRRYNGRLARKKPSFGSKIQRSAGTFRSRRSLIETLELRQMLSANGPALVPQFTDPTQPTVQAAAATSSLMAQTPLPVANTFTLHSNAGSANVIYLDFLGYSTIGTTWNSQSGLPNITT